MTCYRLYTVTPNKKSYWESYYTLEAGIWAMLDRLNVMNCIDLIEDGEFVETEMFGERYMKQYKVEVNCPRTTLVLKKTSTGSWNITNVKQLITKLKNLYIKGGYDERI